MSQGFNFPRFESGKPLLSQLTAERLNAVLDAIDRNRPLKGDNIILQRTPGGVIIRGTPGGETTEAVSGTDPFTVIESVNSDDPPLPTVSFVVGKIGNSIPTLDGAPLTDEPEFTIEFADSFQAWLQVNISTVFDNYHPSIDDSNIEVVTGIVDRVEFKVEWEDDDNKISGAFYILIADIRVELIEGALQITSVDQWLRQSYRGLVLVGGADYDYMLPV